MKYGDKEIDFGEWLQKARKHNKLSRKELHDKSGISVNMLFHIEHHISKCPSLAVIELILNSLGYEIEIKKKA